MHLETPFVPSNLILPPELRGLSVEGDVYNICERIKEISPALFIQGFTNPEYPYVIVEKCIDGIERVVLKAKELDGRVIAHLQKLMAKPLSERVREIEINERKLEAEQKEAQLDELYERLGRPMWTQLEHDGFIESRPVSFPKKGVKPTK
jgi:hypothetical protein